MAPASALVLAHAQDGLITRRQALAAGLTRDAVRHAIRAGGPWQRVLPGIYATFNGPLAPQHRRRAAILHGESGAAISGAWACQMSGLEYGPVAGDWIDVLVPWESARRSKGFVRVCRTTRPPEPRAWIDEDLADAPLHVLLDQADHGPVPGVIPVVPPARAVVETVVRWASLPAQWRPRCSSADGCPGCWNDPGHHRDLALRNTRALMCEAVQRRCAALGDLRAEVAAAPRRGGALARIAMKDIEAGCRSAPECELRDLVRTSRLLPEPRWNQPLPGHRGIRPDACWHQARLVVEVDSRSFHGFGDAPAPPI
ncbi:type IV toxin-antitoxin system AbiEi family antitoxin domain-containing protein [Jiangella anatolica]|uniref:type IV toxin-antitoxin system AbiEi family antitoxin domain-containing protein n=1 Tax=Jiangella anatolica TaxID=2670374 RepID=UPI0011B5A4E5|nr:type IV toxin-antitoxin system AbiEi family antitoxin domain-containing protein [Jiangella anatolica]